MFPLYYNFQSEEIFLQGAGYMKKKTSCLKTTEKQWWCSDVSRDFLGLPFSAEDFRAGAQNDIIENFEE